MQILYPSHPLERHLPDPAFESEFLAARDLGFDLSTFSFADFESGEFRSRPPITSERAILYRGWMLKAESYASLYQAVAGNGARMMTSLKEYLHCHYLPEWYQKCIEFTPKTIFVDPKSDYSGELKSTEWEAWFVKDHVKSLTTKRGSVARSVEEVREIADLIERFRGQIEGGLCIREFEELRQDSEERYFVFNKRPFAREGDVPSIVHKIAERIDSPFYSVDIAIDSNGAHRLIELGDGQVSDRKNWPADRFMEVFRN
jgi:hypothetical protein